MPFIVCAYDFCEHGKMKKIDEPVACSKCGRKRVFHKDCFDKHNEDKHNGKAKLKPIKEIYTK